MNVQRAFQVSKDGTIRLVVMNEHGTLGRMVGIGNMFISSNGARSVFIPMVCLSCNNYDSGEYGELGSKLSPAYCEANVWWPTHKGTCKKYRGYKP